MEEVRNMAMTYYSKLTWEQREEVQRYFQSMDRNGDGRIGFSEFLDFLRVEEAKRSWYHMLFRDLDKDGNGSLDFNEFITFYYLEIFTVVTRCSVCRVILNGNIYFTCVQCFDRRPIINTFDLCRLCYSRNNFRHSHGNGVAPVFRDTSSMLLRAWRENAAGQVATVNNANVNANINANANRNLATAVVAAVNNASNIVNLVTLFLNSGCTIM